MDFLGLSKSRRSIRGFLKKEVSQADIIKLLKAAQSAPSAGNCQPWHFFVLRGEAKELLSKAVYQPFILSAPVVFVVCANIPKSEKRYKERGKTLYCIQDTAAAIQNILLCAKDIGLGSCWIGSFDESAVSDKLNLPLELRPVAIIPVGCPVKFPHLSPGRQPLKKIVTFIGGDAGDLAADAQQNEFADEL